MAAGNTVIVKPSEVSALLTLTRTAAAHALTTPLPSHLQVAPLTGEMVVTALQTVLPSGVVQCLQGDGAVGAALVNAPINMVAMTGSSAVGRKIMKECADDLKRLVLELGGKDPMVVFADSDLDKAAEDAVTFSLFNCGQVCCSVERVYVEESVADSFADKCAALAAEWKVGPGTDETSKVGPMVSTMQRSLVTEGGHRRSGEGGR